MIVQRPMVDIEDDVIKDYVEENMSLRELEKKYGWSWTTLRNMLIKKNVPLRQRGGRRENTGNRGKDKWTYRKINYKAIINGKTLKEWQEFNARISNGDIPSLEEMKQFKGG